MCGSRWVPPILKITLFDPEAALGPGVYALSGKYWDQGDSVLVHIHLQDADGTIFTARRVAALNTIDDGLLPLRPEREFGRIAVNRPGVIRFELESNRGREPTYRIGDALVLYLTTDVDGWLYCFYLQGHDNILVKMFPNALHEDPAIRGGPRISMPGPFFQFNFDMQEPAGVDLVKCFIADRDVTADLPPTLQAMEFAPLPSDMRFRLHEIFRDIPNVSVTEASLVVTVLP